MRVDARVGGVTAAQSYSYTSMSNAAARAACDARHGVTRGSDGTVTADGLTTAHRNADLATVTS